MFCDHYRKKVIGVENKEHEKLRSKCQKVTSPISVCYITTYDAVKKISELYFIGILEVPMPYPAIILFSNTNNISYNIKSPILNEYLPAFVLIIQPFQ